MGCGRPSLPVTASEAGARSVTPAAVGTRTAISDGAWVTLSSFKRKSRCHQVRLYSPSVIERSPMSSCRRTTSRIAASWMRRSSSAEILLSAAALRASMSAAGRIRLPTWSARNGGVGRAGTGGSGWGGQCYGARWGASRARTAGPPPSSAQRQKAPSEPWACPAPSLTLPFASRFGASALRRPEACWLDEPAFASHWWRLQNHCPLLQVGHSLGLPLALVSGLAWRDFSGPCSDAGSAIGGWRYALVLVFRPFPGWDICRG